MRYPKPDRCPKKDCGRKVVEAWIRRRKMYRCTGIAECPPSCTWQLEAARYKPARPSRVKIRPKVKRRRGCCGKRRN